ncbi:hypothetical protein DHEL01_v210881 [Diaporthe helianthi]|uniref:Uncharacterized protein n=1 Tax=Diaporthe helianthi TaxID=158607 RepID=A0A2P5HKF9_DIAHE|nr:hypothetical protein DHEL01_v210881 [Diaporthe helianthi]
MRGKKRPRPTSQSPSRSRSPTEGVDDYEFPETLISKEEAAPIMSNFCQNALPLTPATQSRPDTPGDPAKKDQVRGEERDHDATSSHDDQGSAKAQERSSGDQLLSPPPSERGLKTTWRCGGVCLTDARRVQQLREDGWLVYEEDGDWTDQSSSFDDEEEERGRPRKRRCTYTNGE